MKTLAKSLTQTEISTLTPRITLAEAPANALTPLMATTTAAVISAVFFSTISTVIVAAVCDSEERIRIGFASLAEKWITYSAQHR